MAVCESKSIGEIAYYLGYQYPQYFSALSKEPLAVLLMNIADNNCHTLIVIPLHRNHTKQLFIYGNRNT